MCKFFLGCIRVFWQGWQKPEGAPRYEEDRDWVLSFCVNSECVHDKWQLWTHLWQHPGQRNIRKKSNLQFNPQQLMVTLFSPWEGFKHLPQPIRSEDIKMLSVSTLSHNWSKISFVCFCLNPHRFSRRKVDTVCLKCRMFSVFLSDSISVFNPGVTMKVFGKLSLCLSGSPLCSDILDIKSSRKI